MNDYLKFFACAAVLCVVYPPFLGFVIGIASFLGIMFVVYSILQSVNP
jgi:glycerol-3-phosphate acyltransferase PlsY